MEEVVKKIGKNTIWHLLGKMVNTILSIILVFLIARLLGPESYGTFSLSITFLFMFQQFTSLGLELSLPFFIQKYKSQSKSLLKKYLKLRLTVTIIGSIIFYLTANLIADYYNNPVISEHIRLIAVFTPFFILMNASYQIFQGFNNLKETMKVDIVFSTTKFASVVLIIIGLGVTGSIIGYGVSYIITTIVAYTIIYKKYLVNGKEFTKSRIFFSYALTSFMVGVFSFFSSYLINLFLGFNPVELGYFDSANKIGLFISMVPTALSTALLPNIANKNKKEVKLIVLRLLKYYSIILIPIVLILLSIPNFIINTLLSSDYASISEFLWLIVIGLAINTLTVIYNSIAYGIGKPNYVLISFIIKTSIIIIFSSYLTTAANAAIILLFSLTVSTIISSLMIRKYLKHPLHSYIKSIISSTPLMIALIFDYSIILKVILSSASLFCYSLINYYKVMDEFDRELVRAFVKKIKTYIR